MRDLESQNLARHDLLTVAPAAWAKLLEERSDLNGIPYLADWAERGWPVIVRRRVPGEDTACIPAGLPLPQSLGKRRIGLTLSPTGVTHRSGMTLTEARGAAPAAWQSTLDALIAHGADYSFVPRVFGGLLWQALTGLPYLTATSDLDLLWLCPAAIDRAFLDGLAHIEAEASSQVTRGTRHRNERVWERKTGLPREKRPERERALPTGIRKQALQAWAEIMRALAASPEEADRKLAQSIGHYLGRLPAVQAIVRHHAQQRELPGMSRSTVMTPPIQRRGPEIER